MITVVMTFIMQTVDENVSQFGLHEFLGSVLVLQVIITLNTNLGFPRTFSSVNLLHIES